jgi:hypothetical protein
MGDIHGEFGRLRMLSDSEPGTTFVVLGDVGFGFGLVPRLSNVKYVRGNHDDPHAARMHPDYLGDFGVWDGMFYIGGAFSVDWQWRIERMNMGAPVCWWPDEELDEAALERAIVRYSELKPEIVISHEAPSEIGWMLLQRILIRPEKRECKNSRTAQALQRMFEFHQPKHWYFGHYHYDWTAEVNGTVFHCLNCHSICERANDEEHEERQDHHEESHQSQQDRSEGCGSSQEVRAGNGEAAA